jgi:hypothetical protein
MSSSVASATGDSFLNSCFRRSGFLRALERTSIPIFSWAHPYPLLVLELLVLVILPTIFSYAARTSTLKITRIYSFTRLSLLSIFHQTAYAYTFGTPMLLIIAQPAPCVHASTFGSAATLFQMPDTEAMASALFLFSVARYCGLAPQVRFAACALVLFVYLVMRAALQASSVFQMACGVLLAYVLFSVNLRVPFRCVHAENALWAAFNAAGAAAAVAGLGWTWRRTLLETWFSVVLIAIDEVFLSLYSASRGGFQAVERPADLTWSAATPVTAAGRLLTSELEGPFERYLHSDVRASVAAFLIFFGGVLIRRVLNPAFFAPAS